MSGPVGFQWQCHMLHLPFCMSYSGGSVKHKTWGLAEFTWRARKRIMKTSSKSGMGWRRWMQKSPRGRQLPTSSPHPLLLSLKSSQIPHQFLNTPCAPIQPHPPCLYIFIYISPWAALHLMMLQDPLRGQLPYDSISSSILLFFFASIASRAHHNYDSLSPALRLYVPCLSLLLNDKLLERRSSTLTIRSVRQMLNK